MRGGPGRTATSHTWTNVNAGTYTITVRARNVGGWSPKASATVRVTEPVCPDRPSIRASGGENRASASWSADDNGSPILEWDVDDGGMRGGPGRTVTSYQWTNVAAGTYTITVRARNDCGWSPRASASVTVTAPEPTVRASKGDPGPTGGVEVNDLPCASNSSTCRWLEVTLRDFPPGTYWGRCIHDGFQFSNGEVTGGGYWNEFRIEVGASGTATHSRPCYINFARLVGNGAYIAIDLDGTWITSNWIKG